MFLQVSNSSLFPWKEEITEKQAMYCLGFRFFDPSSWQYGRVEQKNKEVVSVIQEMKSGSKNKLSLPNSTLYFLPKAV